MFGPTLILWVVFILWAVFPAVWIWPGLDRQNRKGFAAVLFVTWLFTYIIGGLISLATQDIRLGGWALLTLLGFIAVDIIAVRKRIRAVRRRKAPASLWTAEDIAFVRSLNGEL